MRLFFALFFLCAFDVFSQDTLTHNVYFNTDKYNILPTEESRLLLFISELDEVPINKISIYGFCDDRGTDNYNIVLSQNRADAIKEVFAGTEIEDSLITNVDGKGRVLLKIVEPHEIHKIRGLNRRVDIIVSVGKPKKEIPTTIPDKPELTKTLKTLASDLKKDDQIRLGTLHFMKGYEFLVPESKKDLKAIAQVLKKRKNIYFTIQGHVCCTVDSRDAINRKTRKRRLSIDRAKYIYNQLVKMGINKRRMRYEGMRRKHPLGGPPRYDRRVELLITYIGEE